MLELNFLGKVRIKLDDQDISSKVSSKSAALLAVLLLQKHKKIDRDKLAGYLWPESAEDAAKYNLRYNLWQLKKLLYSAVQEESFLIVTKTTCQVNERFLYRCDLCEALHIDIAAEDDVTKLEYVRQITREDFFRGQYFAGCDELEELIIMQRYCLENKRLALLKKLVEIYGEKGQDALCLSALQDLEEIDPYDEAAAERRIGILIEQGNYNEAVRYYQTFYNKLAVDIGVQPSDALKRLIGGIGKREASRSVVRIETHCLQSVDCFWMSDVLKQLMEEGSLCFSDYLSAEMLSDLSHIQRRLGKPSVPPSLAVVADAFMELIKGITDGGNQLEIAVHDLDSMDVISRDVLQLLKRTCGEMLEIIEVQE